MGRKKVKRAPAEAEAPVNVRRFPVSLWRRFGAAAQLQGKTKQAALAEALTMWLGKQERGTK